MLSVLPTASASTETHVYPGQSIQTAVNNAIAGDVITVHPGTYNEQVVISKALTLQGFGENTIIRPSQIKANAFALFARYGGGKTAAIVVADASGSDVTIRNLKVDGDQIVANGPVGSNLRQATGLVGVLYRDTAGTLNGLTVEDIGIKNGNDVLLTSLSPASPLMTVEVKNCSISAYLKNGITASGPTVVAEISDNVVSGKGPVTYIAQNGIQVSYGSTGTVHGNKVDGNWYTGANWTSSGILIFESDEVSVQGNSISESQSGITVEAWGWMETSASNNKIVNNNITGADWGVSVAAYAIPGSSASDPVANNNKVINNSISARSGDTGVYFGAYSYGGAFAPTADNNKVISNRIKGYTTPIADESTTGKVHANVSD